MPALPSVSQILTQRLTSSLRLRAVQSNLSLTDIATPTPHVLSDVLSCYMLWFPNFGDEGSKLSIVPHWGMEIFLAVFPYLSQSWPTIPLGSDCLGHITSILWITEATSPWEEHNFIKADLGFFFQLAALKSYIYFFSSKKLTSWIKGQFFTYYEKALNKKISYLKEIIGEIHIVRLPISTARCQSFPLQKRVLKISQN